MLMGGVVVGEIEERCISVEEINNLFRSALDFHYLCSGFVEISFLMEEQRKG